MNAGEANETPFPLLDLNSICKENDDALEEEYLRIGTEIIKAFEEYGFVYLKNCGITEDAIEEILDQFKTFFDLDSDTKWKYERNLSTMHGYTTDKFEIVKHNHEWISERESFDARDFNGCFPDEVPGIEDSVSKLSKQLFPLANKITKAIELALEIPDNLLQKSHNFWRSDNRSCVRVMRYKPITIDIEDQVRLMEHIDSGVTFTLQLYENKQGLQIQERSGEWKTVQVPSNTILLFPSQYLQMWTGDRILATPHRVVVPQTEEERKQSRFSVIGFIHPNDDTVVEPFDGSKTYAPIIIGEHFHEVVKTLYGKVKE